MEKIQGLALDIDNTLAETNERWFTHMHKLYSPTDKSREEIVGNQKDVQDVPEWQSPEAIQQIHTILHSNEFHNALPLIVGADEAVAAIHQHLPIVAYITARPESVRKSTLEWLRRHGFPEAELIMQNRTRANLDTFNEDNNRWKAGVLASLYPQVLGIVDDSVGLADMLQQHDYPGTLYLYGSKHTELNQPHVIVCPTWQDVITSVTAKNY